MRILHIVNYFQPTLGYQEAFLARSQKENGHEVLIVTSERYAPLLFKGGASKGMLGERIRDAGRSIEEGIEVLRLPVLFEILGNPWLIGLEKAVKEYSPDAVHVHSILSITSLRIAFLRKKLKGTRIIFDDHMTYNAVRGKYMIPLYYLFGLLFRRRLLRSADEFVAVTEETKTFMNALYGLPMNRIRTIPLGCDASKFKCDLQMRELLRKEHDIQEEVVFCYVGKMIPDKGVDLLMKASLELLRSGRRIAVLCVGGRDDNYFRTLTELLESSGYKSRFILLPAVPNKELFGLFSMADVGVWPKQCSITMIEAMACSIPVIISDRSGATERVMGKGNGLVYREGDVNDLRTKMEILLDEDTRNQMRTRARSYAESCDWKKISNEFEDLYVGSPPA